MTLSKTFCSCGLKNRLWLPALLLIFAMPSFSATEIRVRIQGAEAGVGPVYLNLMDKASYEHDRPPLLQAKLVKESQDWVYNFQDVPAGDYAVMAFQDLNNDKEPGFSMFSGPNEPFGVSRNVEIGLFPPDWQEIKVKKGQKALSLSINLQ